MHPKFEAYMKRYILEKRKRVNNMTAKILGKDLKNGKFKKLGIGKKFMKPEVTYKTGFRNYD
jgi:hypothetical protein